MQPAVAIIAHALRMLIFEVGTTLRVLSPALILVLGSSIAAVWLLPDVFEALRGPTSDIPMLSGSSVLGMLILGLAGLAGYVLLAILWHRHVLLSGMERTTIMRPSAGIFFSYLGRAIMVGVAQLLVAIPVTVGMGALATVGGGGAAVLSLISLLGGVVFAWIALRISLVLPAAAVDARMTIPDSWEATKSFAPTLWGVAALLVGLNLFLTTLSGLLIPGAGNTVFMVQTFFFLIEGLIFISVLTTLYGHLVEGRPLT